MKLEINKASKADFNRVQQLHNMTIAMSLRLLMLFLIIILLAGLPAYAQVKLAQEERLINAIAATVVALILSGSYK